MADQLLDSVDEFSETDDELDPELREELERRLKSIEDGTAVLLDGDEVMRELRAYFAQGLQNYIDVSPMKGIRVSSASLLDPTKQYGQDWTFSESTKLLVGAGARTELSKAISVRGAYRYGTMWRRYNTTFGTFDNDGNYSERYITTPKQEEYTHSYYALADVRFDTGPIKHTITTGYNGTHIFRELRRVCRTGATVHTYSGATATRTALLLAGFAVGYGPTAGDKQKRTTIAALDPQALEHPLGLSWLESLSRAPAAWPNDAPDDAWACLARHAQFRLRSRSCRNHQAHTI